MPPSTGMGPQPRLERLSDNLWLFRDTANVYVVRAGSKALLIDFGSGAVLDHLTEIGVDQAEWVLHTHHHRAQCQGDELAVARDIRIAVPAHERHLFDDVERFWANRRIFHMYDLKNDLDSRLTNIPVAASLQDGEVFRWQGLDFRIVPTPGHTPGSISLMAHIDGRSVAFSGDLMFAAGTVQTLHDMQYSYGGIEGVDLASQSLKRLADARPDVLCPSHGDPIVSPDASIRETSDKLLAYIRFMGGKAILDNEPYALSPHLIVSHQSCSTFYVIVSDTGRALLIDYGAASDNAMWGMETATPTTGRVRFIEHSLDLLRTKFGVETIDVAMPSHTHDDHILGFPYLRKEHGTKIWSLDIMRPILEHPRDYALGCLLGEAVGVDRAFASGDTFEWEEFSFEIAHNPGHTEYQMALYAQIDGQKVAFTGDAIFPPEQAVAPHRNLLFRNHVEVDSHVRSIDDIIAHQPTVVCPGHWEPFSTDGAYLDEARAIVLRQRQFYLDLLPQGGVGVGLDPSWIRIEPYQAVVSTGVPLVLRVHARNYGDTPATYELRLICPLEWNVEPPVGRVTVAAGDKESVVFSAEVPKSWRAIESRFAIAVDAIVDGQRLGQVTECICEVAGSPVNLQSWS